MELTFNAQGILQRGHGLTYDDVLIVPSKSAVRSRKDPSLSTQITRRYRTELPFISANMDTVTESAMAIAMNNMGGLGILHRFMSIEEQVQEVRKVKDSGAKILAASIGVNEEGRARAEALVKEGVNILTIDIAHGHSVAMIETLKWLRAKFDDRVDLIAGNVATPEATEELIAAGADAIKVGIGPGSMCTTRIITGAGVPQLTAVAWCAQVARSHGVPVIADGGLKASGDVVKALAAGADSVMLGSLLAGTLETPGSIHHGKKHYRGMASRAAQVSWRGGLPEGMAPEGEATSIPVKGHVKDVVLELAGGLRSGMSYINAVELAEIPEKARFMEMSSNGYRESGAHGVK
ncbi:MAG: guanosine monophosphate reductase [Bdellovibrionales bacterium]|nr:guanosine monophosphate reductase [Bdellovibrionales bacterium]